jgi:hypothetical protein
MVRTSTAAAGDQLGFNENNDQKKQMASGL